MTVDVNNLLAKYDAEIGRLTRRALLAESELEAQRAENARLMRAMEGLTSDKPADEVRRNVTLGVTHDEPDMAVGQAERD